MTNDNNIPTMTDADLDQFLNDFAVPDFDEKAFDKRMMACICDADGISASRTGFLWFRPAAAMVAALVAVFAFILFYQVEGPANSPDSSNAVIAGVQQSSPMDEQEITVLASASWDSSEFADTFYNEMADQDILISEYMPEDFGDDASVDEVPPIDEFLDNLLGIESRQL